MAKTVTKQQGHEDCWNTIGVWGDVYPRCEKLSTVVHCRNCEVYSRAGRNVFERRPPKGYVTQWRETLAKAQTPINKQEIGVMVFRLAKEWYAISATVLHEVADYRVIHRIPRNENPFITGVVNIGGEVRICYSLSDLLSDGAVDEPGCQRLLVVDVDSQRFVFPVDEVTGLERCNIDELLPVPGTIAHEKANLILGICNVEKRKVGVLDIENICHLLNEGST
jgi:chemotaxis-related protein WspD